MGNQLFLSSRPALKHAFSHPRFRTTGGEYIAPKLFGCVRHLFNFAVKMLTCSKMVGNVGASSCTSVGITGFLSLFWPGEQTVGHAPFSPNNSSGQKKD